jgi:predicted HAD superfamily phosphohydrolase
MSKINPGDWSKPVRINGMEITIKPQTYEDYNKNNISNFDEQRLIQIVQNQDLDDDEKTRQFDEIFQKLIETGIDTVSKNIASIKTDDGIVVDNPVFIRDFLDNCDKAVWDAIKQYLDVIRASNDYNKVTLTCSNEECTKEFTTPFIFEQTNFFG